MRYYGRNSKNRSILHYITNYERKEAPVQIFNLQVQPFWEKYQTGPHGVVIRGWQFSRCASEQVLIVFFLLIADWTTLLINPPSNMEILKHIRLLIF